MENFDPDYICNHSDDEGRYRYKAQPDICKWNLLRLADAWDPNVSLEYSQKYIADNYSTLFQTAYNTKMGQKLGFLLTSPPDPSVCDGFSGTKKNLVNEEPEARKLTYKEEECIKSLFETMAKSGADFTDAFRILG